MRKIEKKLNKNKWLKWVEILYSRVIVFYLVIFILSSLIIDYKNVQFQSNLRVLNSIAPKSFAYLVDLAEGRVVAKTQDLQPYGFFYYKVTQFIPNQVDAYSMLGFCYYHLGDYGNAVKYFQTAVKLQPNNFWHSYNLAITYFKMSNFKEAKSMFQKALQLSNVTTLAIINQSTAIYTMIKDENSDYFKGSVARLEKARSYSIQLLVLSNYYLNDYEQMFQASLQAINNGISFPEVYYFYAGYAAYQMKSYVQAQALFKNCIKVSPEFADAWEYLGLTMQALNDAQFQTVLFKAQALKSNAGLVLTKENLLAPAVQFYDKIHPQFF